MTKEQKGALSWAIAEAKAYNFEITANALAAILQAATSDAPADHIVDANKKVDADSVPVAGKDKWVAKVHVTHKGYSMELSKYIAYALPEGMHELYAKPPHTEVNNG